MSRIRFLLHGISRQLWLRAAIFACMGIGAAVLSRIIGPFVPQNMVDALGVEATGPILNILATSMLAVTTFSLSIMVSTYASAAQSVTPRAVELLLQDHTSQTVLSTFLGAFLFALIGLIAEEAGLYGTGGRVVLFLSMLAVIAGVIWALLQWIGHLSRFGRLSDTTDRVEVATAKALQERSEKPFLGGVPLISSPEEKFVANSDGTPLFANDIGYIRHIDVERLNFLASRATGIREVSGPILRLQVLPGSFVHHKTPLLVTEVAINKEIAEAIRLAFVIGPQRTFDQDPRFGLCVLAEIAQRALSPAVNDPGTAIDVLSRAIRLFAPLAKVRLSLPDHPLVGVPGLILDDCFHDLFGPIARDGADNLEVQIRLQKALLALAETSPVVFGGAALTQSKRALSHARSQNLLTEDLARLERIGMAIANLATEVRKPVANLLTH